MSRSSWLVPEKSRRAYRHFQSTGRRPGISTTNVLLLVIALLLGLQLVITLCKPTCKPTPPKGGSETDNDSKLIPPGTTVELEPIRPEIAPPFVRDKELIRQSLKKGTTHKTVLQGAIETVGTDRFWGIESVVSIYYKFVAEIDREIIENDGSVVVEHRHFRNVRSLKIDTDLKDLKVHLGPALIPIRVGELAFPTLFPVVSKFDGLSAAPVIEVLKAMGVDPLKISGAHKKIVKLFTQVDSLSGKSIKQVYWNKEDRTGVISVAPLSGDMTDQEEFFHRHSAVLSDVLIFPERTKAVGESWQVKGSAFSNLIDPGLRAAVGGEVSMSRRLDRVINGKSTVILAAEDGRLTLESDDRSQRRIGWFEPRGELLFSPNDDVVVEAQLSGKGLLEKVSKNHLLFQTEMKQEPEIRVTYSCRVVDTPAGEQPRAVER